MTAPIDVTAVSQVYNGRHGCACGCRGNYSSTPRSIRQIVAKINQAAADGHTVHVHGWGVWVDTPTRSYTAYTDGRH